LKIRETQSTRLILENLARVKDVNPRKRLYAPKNSAEKKVGEPRGPKKAGRW